MTLKLKRIKVNKNRVVELVDGLMLSDGYIDTARGYDINDRLAIEVRYDSIEWLKWIRNFLQEYGISSKIFNRRGERYVRICDIVVHGNPTVMLRTERHPFFTKQRKRWYPNGKKEVPKDVKLTPLSLAQWYMGDGSLMVLSKDSEYLAIKLSTQSFSYEENCFLADKLKELGFEATVYRRKEINDTIKYVIYVLGDKSVKRFLNITEPYKVSCFEYKWDVNRLLEG